MKKKIWLLQLPLIALFSYAFVVVDYGSQGEELSPWVRENIYPSLRTIQGKFTDLKFRFRGTIRPRNKIVVVEIDSPSLEQYGRWPWHRDKTAYLIERVAQAGAKVIGLDMTFSEPDQRVSDNLRLILEEHKLSTFIQDLETDNQLAATVEKYRSKLVMGWTSETFCTPAFEDPKDCPANDPEKISPLPEDFNRFAYDQLTTAVPFVQEKSKLVTALTFIPNLPLFANFADHSGYFNTWPDEDGVTRRTNLVFTAQGKAFPSLALQMAKVGLGEKLELVLDPTSLVQAVRFGNSQIQIATTKLGAMEINFRGPGYTFQYMSALDIMEDSPEYFVSKGRTLASMPRENALEFLKDAYVLIGVSALGAFDMRAFPTDSNVPGVEGHANILDNILSNDWLVPESANVPSGILLRIMTLGAILFSAVIGRLESVPALLLFMFVMSGATWADFKWLFSTQQINLNTSLFYIEMTVMFMFTIAIKYVLEEQNKKFIKGAFSKYVAPTIVDSILKDPTKLTVGGEKRELSILFSDIRSFTSFSENMDAKRLSQFLNEYLGLMTDLIFEHQGTLDKYIGDAVMAFWGAPLDQAGHGANAIKTAIRMQQVLAENRPRFKETYGVDVHIGIGINSGHVSVGNMGSERIFEYTVIGDHVNLASRLEGLTKTYGAGIVTSRFTLDTIEANKEPLPPHRSIDLVKVKGKKNAVELIQILDFEAPNEGLAAFTEGRKLYTAQQWDAAISEFEKSNALFNQQLKCNDETALIFIERCQFFKANPPEKDWDGSWEMHSK
jgi:adenylate cyclase